MSHDGELHGPVSFSRQQVKWSDSGQIDRHQCQFHQDHRLDCVSLVSKHINGNHTHTFDAQRPAQ
jgi:hypothetical protein